MTNTRPGAATAVTDQQRQRSAIRARSIMKQLFRNGFVGATTADSPGARRASEGTRRAPLAPVLRVAKTRLAKAGVAVAALAGSLIAFAPAASAVTCYGDYCSGQDPSSSGCSADAFTVAATDVAGGRLELRWSPRCKTNWARWQQYPARIMTPVPIQIRALQDTGYVQRAVVADDTGYAAPGTYWTPMIYSPVRAVRAEAAMTCFGIGDCAQSTFTGNPVLTGWA